MRRHSGSFGVAARLLAPIAFWLVWCGAADAQSNDRGLALPVVVTEAGPVRGAVVGGAFAFKGIPYAAPPIGSLRWRAPAPAIPWPGVHDGTVWGPKCIQLDGPKSITGSEDCLVLNVWRPATTETSLPVLFFIHGGSNVSGSSSDRWLGVDVYDGAYVAEHGPALFVSVNYRLAAMGFLAHPDLADASGPGVVGNYGLLDQIAALEWVQRNIAAFGGDPSRVMVFGQSAGAFDTCNLLASPLAKGLFSSAMMMSGGCGADTHAHAVKKAEQVAHSLSCDAATYVASCLRGQTAEVVTLATGYWQIGTGTFFGASVDADPERGVAGYVVPEQPLETIRSANHSHVPLIIGTTQDEMSHFVSAFTADVIETPRDYRAKVSSMYTPGWASQILAAYPASAYPTPMKAFEALLADEYFICPSRRAALATAKAQIEPVRRYVFAHAFMNKKLTPRGADHGFDIFFALHNLGGKVILATKPERDLADAMVGYWTRFAASGDPNGAGAHPWPAYDPQTHEHLVLDTSIKTAATDRTSQCTLWDSLEDHEP